MKKICLLLALLLCLSALSGCAVESPRTQNFYLMDTLISVTLYTKNAREAEEIFSECETLLKELDGLWSRQKPESEVARFNASASGIVDVDARTIALLQTALDVSAATNGAFDVTVTPLVELWAAAEEANRLPSDVEMTEALARVGYASVDASENAIGKTCSDTEIDLGGIGKGAAISYLIDFLEQSGARGGLVSFGSNVAVFGEKPIGKLTMPAGSILSVSGDYERYVTIGGERYHHILNPETGYPAANGLASVAVIARDGALADALSTALFVMGEEQAMTLYASGRYDFEAIFVDVNGAVRYTDGLSQAFLLEE